MGGMPIMAHKQIIREGISFVKQNATERPP